MQVAVKLYRRTYFLECLRTNQTKYSGELSESAGYNSWEKGWFPKEPALYYMYDRALVTYFALVTTHASLPLYVVLVDT